MTQLEKIPRAAPPPPAARTNPQPARRSIHQKYPPLLGAQLNYEVHTEPPTSPKHEESKIAHNGTKKPPRHSQDMDARVEESKAGRSLAKELQHCKAELLKVETINAKLISKDAITTQKYKQAEVELRRAKEEKSKIQNQNSVLQSKVLRLAAENEGLQSERREVAGLEEELARVKRENSELKDILELNSQNLAHQEMRDQIFELFEGVSGGDGRSGEVSALRGQLMRYEQQIENQRREIEELKELLDEKENRITTPKSSRERTPQNHGRLRMAEPQQSHQLLDFGGNEEEAEIEAMPRRQRMERVFRGEEESKTPPTSTAYHNLMQLDQDLLNQESPLDMAQPAGMMPPQQLSPFPSFGMGSRPEELMLRNDDPPMGHTTPRTNQPYDERGSRRGSRASTPTKDQADTPTRQSQRQNQQLVHNLSSNQIYQRPQQAEAGEEEEKEEEEDGVQVIPNSYFFN